MTKVNNSYTWVPFSACLILIGLAWLNSGTLSPYAATLGAPLISTCGYLLNIDHSHFEASFHFLNGSPGEHSTLLLRRILYPLLAYMPMKFFRWLNNPEWFIWGGFITNLAIYCATIFLLWFRLKKNYGIRAAIFGLLIVITYPGIYYWIGSPYAYNWIIPGSILGFLALDYTARNEQIFRQLLAALVLGLVFLGYDLWAFFLPASLILLLLLRRFTIILPFLFISMLPALLYFYYLKYVSQVALANDNSGVYRQIISSYFNPDFYAGYLTVIESFFSILSHNFLFSNFLFLPAFFVVIYLANHREDSRFNLTKVELSLLLAVFIVFCFNNLAPYSDARWQMRGAWIARLYQPVGVVFMFCSARILAQRRPDVTCLACLMIFLNLTVVLTPILNIPATNFLFYNFYRHSPSSAASLNWEIWGRRPLGLCLKPKKVKRIKQQLKPRHKNEIMMQ